MPMGPRRVCLHTAVSFCQAFCVSYVMTHMAGSLLGETGLCLSRGFETATMKRTTMRLDLNRYFGQLHRDWGTRRCSFCPTSGDVKSQEPGWYLLLQNKKEIYQRIHHDLKPQQFISVQGVQ